MHAVIRFAVLASAVVVTGCNSSFNVDVVAQGYGDTRAVTLNLDGLQAKPLGTGKLRTLTRNATLELAVPGQTGSQTGAQTTALVSDAKLADDEYSGVRLRFDDVEGSVTDSRIGALGTFPIARASDDDPDADLFADVAFTFKKDSEDTVSVIIAIDVPLSLTFDDGNGEYTLDPVVRAMESGDEASVSGTVQIVSNDIECTDGGIAVYAFKGGGIVPNERGGGPVEPIATAPVSDSSGGIGGGLGNGPRSFALRFLPPGDYTLAVTCEAEEDNGNEAHSGNDTIDFGDPEDLRLDAGDDVRDFRLSI